MKKFAVLAALAVVFAFAAPVFAATNPFMDVPMNHWAYDAIGQLAAHGILSGYPDGTYKGQQPTTRYEMASALARALAVVDMTKASKQDVEMLKKLVVEFKDELEALGVKVAEIDDKVALLDERLGGWKLSGILRLDVENRSAREAPTGDGDVFLQRARVRIERWFGDPDNPMHFVSIIGNNGKGSSLFWKDFYVEIPFFFDTTLIAGRFGWDAEAKYYVNGDNIGSFAETGGYFGMDSVLTDIERDALGVQKNFGIGNVKGFVAHLSDSAVMGGYSEYYTVADTDGVDRRIVTDTHEYSAWELFGMGEFQFTENIGFDIGFDGYIGDNAEPESRLLVKSRTASAYNEAMRFNSLWSIFAGLRFNFNEDIAFKAIYYYQKKSVDYWLGFDADGDGVVDDETIKWRERKGDDESANHWAVMLDVNQNLLKFTSVWLEYGQYDAGFVNPNGGAIMASGLTTVPADLKYYRAVLAQQWNEQWATHLFYYGYDFDLAQDWKPKEWGLGVQYTLNPNATIGLNYMKVDYDVRGRKDDNRIRLRTQVTF